MKHRCTPCSCGCPPLNGCPPTQDYTVSRRAFLRAVGGLAAAGAVWPARDLWAFGAGKQLDALGRKPLRVQPVLTYDTPVRLKATSWRGWGGIQTDEQAQTEKARIEKDLGALKSKADFPLDILPVALIKTVDQARGVATQPVDVTLIYAAGAGGDVLEALSVPGRWGLMFLRHDPGPVYLWYEIVHPRFLRKTVDDFGQPGWDVRDVVVDQDDDVLWRLRALAGLKNTLGKKILCIGGASGWGEGGSTAPDRARKLWQMDLVDVPYKDLEPRISKARGDARLAERCASQAEEYLKHRGTRLETDRQFVDNAFVLLQVFKDLMAEAQTDAMTVNLCMGPIMSLSQTTACLPLSVLNDEGHMAFCESDFVVIPSGVLLHAITGLPVFLNDPTTPHDGMVTLAHCTAPRKMNGKKMEPARILTHFESDYGAAPKVAMNVGEICTNLVPDFRSEKWVGFKGTIEANPFLDICRSQIDVRIHGDDQSLLQEMKGFHWMMSYGDAMRECEYALNKVGVAFLNLSGTEKA